MTRDDILAAARFYRRQGAQELVKRRFILALPA